MWQEQSWQERDAKLGKLHFNIMKAQKHMKLYVDKERKEVIFEVGSVANKVV